MKAWKRKQGTAVGTCLRITQGGTDLGRFGEITKQRFTGQTPKHAPVWPEVSLTFRLSQIQSRTFFKARRGQ